MMQRKDEHLKTRNTRMKKNKQNTAFSGNQPRFAKKKWAGNWD